MIEFFVPGIPKPGGSKTAGFNRKTGKSFVRPACDKVKGWMQTVAYFAYNEYKGELLTGPIRLSMTFVMPRPKNHYGTGRNTGILKPTAPYWHAKTPDRTKLMRSTEDALTKIIWTDDSQVCAGPTNKIYGEKTGVAIIVESIQDGDAEPDRRN